MIRAICGSAPLQAGFGLLILVVAFATVFAGCGPSGGGSSGGILTVLSLDVQGRTDVARNEPITVRFSTVIDPLSVAVAGFQVLDPAGGIVEGRIVINGDRITFFPTSFDGVDGRGIDQSVNNYNPPSNPSDNAIGFDSGVRYTIRVLGGSTSSPTTLSGRPLVETFFGSFRTGGSFFPEPSRTSPFLIATPQFNQVATNDECNPDSLFGDPGVQCPPALPQQVPVPSFDPTDIEISLSFSEPMNPATINPFSTLKLNNVTFAEPRPVFGEIQASADLRTIRFRPFATLGDDPRSEDPFVFELTLSPEVTDLAGNPLAGNPDVDGNRGILTDPLVFRFSTIDKPGEPTFEFFLEEFSDQVNRAGLLGGLGTNSDVWTGNGVLEGSPVRMREAEIPISPSGVQVSRPLIAAGSRTQFLIDATIFNALEFGLPESVIGLSWGPQSNFVAAAHYPEISLSIGHTSADVMTGGLQPAFAGNYNGFENNPSVVYRGAYTLNSSLNRSFVRWPQFLTDFEYDGQSNIVLDFDVLPGGDTFQLFRNEMSACLPRNRIYGQSRAATAGSNLPCGVGDDANVSHRFLLARKTSFGVSRFLDTGFDTPDYEVVAIDADESRVGTRFNLFFSGRPRVGALPRPDDTILIGPSTDINLLDGFRFLSFTFELIADPFTGLTPSIDLLAISFRGN